MILSQKACKSWSLLYLHRYLWQPNLKSHQRTEVDLFDKADFAENYVD